MPGWGQWYNHRPTKAFLYGGAFVLCMGMAARNWDTAIGTEGTGSLFWDRDAWRYGRNNWLILGGFVYLLAAVDAYVDAHLQTFDVSPLAFRLRPARAKGILLVATVPLAGRVASAGFARRR